ncbi:multidrug efflux system, subunit A [Verrucomicrobia bacterium]|nr:multidrug efflux system, subunit A [Verrucomicrobiota bacterium]
MHNLRPGTGGVLSERGAPFSAELMTDNKEKTAALDQARPLPGRILPPPDPARKPGHLGWFIAGAVILLIAAGIFWQLHARAKAQAGANASRAAAAMQAIPVTITNVVKGDIGEYVSGLGMVTPVYTVSVKSRVDGQLMTVNYQEGQVVKAGDSLAEIDPRPYQAALEQAQGQYIRDNALLTNALIDLKRYQVALASNAIPEQQLATQQATVHQYEGTVKLDQAQIDSAQVNLDYCHIASPITGRVGLRLVDPGNIVHATDSNPLATIAQIKPITVEFTVAEDYLPRILPPLRQGQKLAVEAYDRTGTNKLTTGSVLTLDNQIDPSTGTVKIRAQFENEDEALFPNQFVNARLLVALDHDAMLVPAQCIQRNPEGSFVYLVKPDQTVTMKQVQIRTTDASTGVTAVEGVQAGDPIVADNFNRLQEGAKVISRQALKAENQPSGGQGHHRGGG